MAFALAADSPRGMWEGFLLILQSPDILMVDYIYKGGLGGSLLNAVIAGIFCVILMKAFKCPPTGLNIASVWLVLGFAFFGKNILNIIPIVFGSYLYSIYVKRPFKEFAALSLLSTSLGPVVSQFAFIGENFILMVILGIAMGVFAGFIMMPLCAFTKKAHEGYNLYNVGFAAGLLGMIFAATIRSLGHELELLSYWSYGNNVFLSLFALTISSIFLIFGLILKGWAIKGIFSGYYKSASEIQDYYVSDPGFSYISMGIGGIFAMLFVLIFNGQLNGPLLGAVFTIIGFAALGKNIFNMLPIAFGCIAFALLAGRELNSPDVLIAALFSSTLAPIPANFGVFWGFTAGIMHISLAATLAQAHGGLNLYNNGVTGGFVAILLLPVIRLFVKDS